MLITTLQTVNQMREKMALFVVKDLFRLGLILFFSHFQNSEQERKRVRYQPRNIEGSSANC